MSLPTAFIAESNGIEGIWRDPLPVEIEAHQRLLAMERMSVVALEEFVANIAPGHRLRDRRGLDVRVGSHVPPIGGREMRPRLKELLRFPNYTDPSYSDPYDTHLQYEALHPFTDGNGRSGRALWVWHMLKQDRDPFALRFLHRWYYESLEAV